MLENLHQNIKHNQGTVLKEVAVHEYPLIQYGKAWDFDNPLFSDPEYAKKTKWGGVIAFPSFINCLGMFDSVFILTPSLIGGAY